MLESSQLPEAGNSSDECESNSSEECVDVLGSPGLPTPPTVPISPGPDTDRTEEDALRNNFSIDRILGLRNKDATDAKEKFARPIPLPVIPRASKFFLIIKYIFNLLTK